MRLPLAEADDLVFDRRTVPRSRALDLAGVNGRTRKIGPDDRMGLARRCRDMAGYLSGRDRLGQEGEWNRRIVSLLHLQALPADAAAIEPCRCSRFQPSELKPE